MRQRVEQQSQALDVPILRRNVEWSGANMIDRIHPSALRDEGRQPEAFYMAILSCPLPAARKIAVAPSGSAASITRKLC